MLALPLSGFAASLSAQGALAPDAFEQQQRLLEILGRRAPQPVGGWNLPRGSSADSADREDPWAERRPSTGYRVFAGGPELRLLPLELRAANNSARPWGINDGPVWQGRGLTTALSGGVALRWGPLDATLQPVLWRAANQDFALSPYPTRRDRSPFSYPGAGSSIDYPQRFGERPLSRLDAGQSALRLRGLGMVVGVSTETQRWGPQRRNPFILSQNAAGYERAYVGTAQPANIGIGTLHVQWNWGRLQESAFFDTIATNNRRFVTGATASFMPAFAPNLELGVTRVFVSRWPQGGPSFRQLMEVWMPVAKVSFADSLNPSGNDARDQLASMFFRWIAPQAGLELYGEWARGDHSWDLRDFTLAPEHASAFALGFQRALPSQDGAFWHFGGELSILGSSRTQLVRPGDLAFYYHGSVTQGYTQRGQIPGAGIGPGSSQLSLEFGRVASWGRASVTAQRTVYNNDRYYRLFDAGNEFQRYEAEPAVIAEALFFRGPLEVGGSLALAKLYNKHYQLKDDETNVQLALLARYRWP